MTHVTFETAKRLKEAGFPQPEQTVPGSAWFSGKTLWIMGASDAILPPHRWFAAIPTFAPTATDILAQMLGWSLEYTENGWVCFESILGGHRDFTPNSNPAEACAEAWFFEQDNMTQ